MKVAYKVWLDNGGKAFGEGPYQLLKHVEVTGSLHKTALDLRMSYRKAWATLHRAEKKLGFALLERKIGGVSGGGSQITPEGRALMANYERFREEIKALVEKAYQKYLSDL